MPLKICQSSARMSGVSKLIPSKRGMRDTVGTRGASRALRLRGFFGVADFSVFHMVGLCECSLASEAQVTLTIANAAGRRRQPMEVFEIERRFPLKDLPERVPAWHK